MSRSKVAAACAAIVLAAGLLFSLSGCSRVAATTADGRPRVLHYAHMPAAEEMQDSSLRTELMRKYLERELHMPVEMVSVSAYATTIEAMRADRVDVATFGPFGYIIAVDKAKAQAIVASGTAEGRLNSYNSVIAVPKDSPLHTFADLKAHAKETVFLFTDPASTSGNLVPRAYMESQGMDPDKDFKKVVYAGQQPAAILTVKAKKVDAGTFSGQILGRLQSLGKLAPDELRVIWTSDPIPSAPICVRNNLPEGFKKEIQRALLAIPQKDPQLWNEMKKFYRRPEMTFVAVDDSMYSSVRQLARNSKGVEVLDEK